MNLHLQIGLSIVSVQYNYINNSFHSLRKQIRYLWLGKKLTALNRYRSNLEGQDFSTGLWDVHTKHKSHSCIFPPNIRLPLTKFYIRIAEFQNACTVNTVEDNREDSNITSHILLIINKTFYKESFPVWKPVRKQKTHSDILFLCSPCTLSNRLVA